MCDRICLTDPSADRIALQQTYGVRDNALLTTERFSEWIVEKWMGDKPEGMKDVGIKLVASTVPYENLKIRLNYGTRLAVAIVGKALGFTTFEDAMQDEAVKKFANKYMDEVGKGVGDVPKDTNLDAYKSHMIERMSTGQLNYVTHRVVESASKKLRTDLLPVLENISSANSSTPAAALTIAIWAHLISGSPLCQSDGFPIIDVHLDKLEPLAKVLLSTVRQSGGERAAEEFISEVFGTTASFSNSLAKQVIGTLKQFEVSGIQHSILKLAI
jgi:mannitol-1-phosphate/altronate dehydrogenase